MKAKDAQRLEAIRFLNAAIKQREIELRESGGQVSSQLHTMITVVDVICGC
jgi:uncharacterized protein YqeY